MSNLASGAEDYPEAAAKHLQDATELLRAGRVDGAAYLAGYVVECALKTLVVLNNLASAGRITFASLAAGNAPSLPQLSGAITSTRYRYSHDLDRLSRDLLALAALPGASTARYAPPPAEPTMYPGGWSEYIRYHAPRLTQSTAALWLTHAEAVYAATVAKLRLDGVVR